MAQSWLHSARTVARSPGLSASSQVQSVRNRAMGCGERERDANSEPARKQAVPLERPSPGQSQPRVCGTREQELRGTFWPGTPPARPMRF